jgi:hypothetical protein
VDDGVVSAYDASLVLNWLAELDTLSDTQELAADADANGSIEALDAAFIARYAVGIKSDALSRVGTWKFIPASKSYSSVVTPYTQQDFSAFVLGDVSESWGSSSGSGKALASAFCPDKMQIQDGDETLVVPFSAQPGFGVLSLDLAFRYDPSCLQFEDVTLTDVTESFNVACNEETPGSVRIALYGTRPVAGGTLLNIRFRIRNSSFGQSVVRWEEAALNEIPFPAQETLLVSSVQGNAGKPASFGLAGNYPNPFNPSTVIAFSLDRAGETSLVLYDVHGREVRGLSNNWKAAGEYKVEWDGRDAGGREVPTGLYLCRLENSGRVAVIKLLKEK